jgi:hypothetical protein
MKTLFVVTILIISFAEAHSQVISIPTDTVSWQVDSLTDVAHDHSNSYTCTFTTYGTSKIVWMQSADNVTEFPIQAAAGGWGNPQAEGHTDYSVTYQAKTGKLWFERTADGIRIKMTFMENGENTMPFIFRVTSVNKIH